MSFAPKGAFGPNSTKRHTYEGPGIYIYVYIVLFESQSKPGINGLPENCKEMKRRPHPFMAEIVPYSPPITRVLSVTHLRFRPLDKVRNALQSQQGKRTFVSAHVRNIETRSSCSPSKLGAAYPT